MRKPIRRVSDDEVLRVLLVDDNSDHSKSLAMLLRFAGHEVVSADGGWLALELAEGHKPDVVFLDIGMPGMNGLQLAVKLREREETKHATIVAITAYGSPDDVVASSRAGIDIHCVKPVKLERLTSIMHEAAARRRLAWMRESPPAGALPAPQGCCA